MNENEDQDYLALKWGSLKRWKIKSERGQELLQQYFSLGVCASAIMQKDTPEQKRLICEIIDECSADTVYLDWEGVEVSKEEAKHYVMQCGQPPKFTNSCDQRR